MTKTCLITGVTSGIGKATVFTLAKKDISLILISKNEKKVYKECDQILKINKNINIKPYICDLSSLRQVQEVAKDIKANSNSIDIMINNAGALFNSYYLSDEGYELTFATNYLGSFLLTLLLLDCFKVNGEVRILNISSSSHLYTKFDINDIANPKVFQRGRAYNNSKLAILFFTYELSRLLEHTNITINALDPGHVATRIKLNNGLLPWLRHYVKFGIRGKLFSTSRVADSILYLALDEKLNNISGKYFYENKMVPSSEISYDKEIARKFFKSSLKMTGLNESELLESIKLSR
jgi:retinol dehydrogenase-12